MSTTFTPPLTVVNCSGEFYSDYFVGCVYLQLSSGHKMKRPIYGLHEKSEYNWGEFTNNFKA